MRQFTWVEDFKFNLTTCRDNNTIPLPLFENITYKFTSSIKILLGNPSALALRTYLLGVTLGHDS